MARRVCLLLVSLLVPLSLSHAAELCVPGASSLLRVSLHPQETNMWCWAASGQMVMDYLGRPQSQCAQVNRLLGGRAVCSCNLCPRQSQTPLSLAPSCARGGWPLLEAYGFSFENKCNEALSWDELRQQLSDAPNCRKTPVLFSWRYRGGGGHIMVAIGYRTVDGENFVEILDPASTRPCRGVQRLIPYREYVKGPSAAGHWHDYYNIDPMVTEN